MENKTNELEYNKLLSLPKGWVWTMLEDFAVIIQGQSPPSSTYNQKGNGLPFYQGKAEFNALYPTPQNWCVAPKKVAEKGDVLISVRAPVGPTNICPEKSCIGRGLAAIHGLGGIDTFFILYLLRTFERVLAGRGTGTTFNAITGDTLRNLVVPLPPLPEQRRVVSKIEELFTRLDAGVEALRKVKAEIKRYRQAVLKHAFEGRLTEEWREVHKGELEPASVLLGRIEQERKKNAKDKFKDLPPVDASELPSLPEGWVWTRVCEVCLVVSGQTPKGVNDINGIGNIPFYKVSDMNRTGNEKFMDEAEFFLNIESAKKLRINLQVKGTVIFPKRGGAIATNKKRILTRQSAYDLNVMGVYPLSIPSMFFYYWISKIDLATLSDGSNVPQINHKDIDPLFFPLPSLPEQHKIVEEIERHFSIAEKVEASVDQCLKQAERLRQSILKRAFEGRLVPQDPTDEPAEKLIERIKLEKTKQSNEGKIKQAKRKMPNNNLLRKPF